MIEKNNGKRETVYYPEDAKECEALAKGLNIQCAKCKDNEFGKCPILAGMM